MTKICKRCREEKDCSEFSKWKLGRDGYQDWCKACFKVDRDAKRDYYLAKHAEYYQEHAEKMKADSIKWKKEHPEEARAIQERYRTNHIDEIRERHLSSWHKNYEKNRDKIIERAKQRRLFKKSVAIRDFTGVQWSEMLKEYNNKCAYCGLEFSKAHPPTQDHVIPLVKGGNHTKSNIVPACRSCNSRKRSRTPEEWKNSATFALPQS